MRSTLGIMPQRIRTANWSGSRSRSSCAEKKKYKSKTCRVENLCTEFMKDDNVNAPRRGLHPHGREERGLLDEHAPAPH